MLRQGNYPRRNRLITVGYLYQNFEAFYERKKRSYSIDPDHRGRVSSAMKTFEIYRQSAVEGRDANFRRFIRLPLDLFNDLLTRIEGRLTHQQTHSDPISAETRLVLTLRSVK